MELEVIQDVNCDRVKEIIEKQGHGAEHNFYHYLNVSAMYEKAIFPVFDGKFGLLGFVDKGNYWCYTDPLAPEEKRLDILRRFVEWAFEDGAKKIRAEVGEELWKHAKASMKNFRFVKPSYVFTCPVYDLKKWDPAMNGADWKKLRNLKNAFLRAHKVEILNKNQVSKEDIVTLIERWKKNRTSNDRVFGQQYFSSIEKNFVGYDSVRFISVDGTIRAMNGGWKIPNSNNFYSQLGMHDYTLDGMGEFSYIEDLTFLKTQGYDFADFGGGSGGYIAFKKKFKPANIYNEMEFSILKK